MQDFLLVQWLRIHFPMQGTRAWSLVEDSTCHGATKPICHNYWARVLEITSHKIWSPSTLEPVLCNKSSVQLLSCDQLFATPWTVTRQASLSITNCQSLPKPMSIESVMLSNHLILCRPLLLLPWIFPSISSVQLLSCVWLFATPWTAAHQASLSITNFRSSPKLMFIESVMPSNHLILCRPLLLLPSIFPNIRIFSNESALRIRQPKYWSSSFNISPSNEYPGLISFRMDWLDLLAVQGTHKSLLQHHYSKAPILLRSAFFIVQLSHPYVTTGKTRALSRRTFVGKVMFLLFNMLSRLVITFLPRSKRLLISWLQSPSAVILEPPKIR